MTLAPQDQRAAMRRETELFFDTILREDRDAQAGQVRLLTRNGHDWTHKLPELQRALRDMELPDGWYDGEIVMPAEKSAADFQALQSRAPTPETVCAALLVLLLAGGGLARFRGKRLSGFASWALRRGR